jgi:hypothetical protein
MLFTVHEVYTIKLNSGEELIAKIKPSASSDGYVTISNPVSVAPGPQGMGLVPSLFTVNPDSTIKLNTLSIAVFGLTEENVKAKYVEATTGLKIPDKKIVLQG